MRNFLCPILGDVWICRNFQNSGDSEFIRIPKPSKPMQRSRSGCPHLRNDVLDWHDAGTWTIAPTVGADVTLPDNTAVLLQQSVGFDLGLVTIPSTSSLIIGEDSNGISLDVHGLDVKGDLILGSETCRLTTPVTITLHGSRISNPSITYKGIGVTGKLHLHGTRYFSTWTRLSQSANPGNTKLYVQDDINWEVGQQIVLVTTALKDSREWHQNEVHVVSGVSGREVSLESSVQHTHISNAGYQAEVGLLSRSIVIQGSESDSEPSDLDPMNCVYDGSYSRFGDTSVPCPYTEITGFGGHVMVHGGGQGFVQGVQFYRMGMTNILGRYPMHFHLLGDCPECYITDSTFLRSYYRCVSIHGTNSVTVSENVAYDVTGYCYYLEDGVEENNVISYNLGAFIHSIGPNPPGANGQRTALYQQNDRLTLPADVTASAFYITNVHNELFGNAASGGWAGFAFPSLPTALQSFRNLNFRPSSATSLKIDGNSAHSTGWWWSHAGAFYNGGSLYYNSDNVLEYNPGRVNDFQRESRVTCKINACAARSDCACPAAEKTHITMTNTKTFLASGTGFNSWSGRMEILGYESYDNGLSIESLSNGFWIDRMLSVCRTGESLTLPNGVSARSLGGTGFVWYDTGQEHIITKTTFRNCGYRSSEFDQYDSSPDRGCGDDDFMGCNSRSTVFGFLTHSDQFTPEIMQGTKEIEFDNCGRRFAASRPTDSVSARGQNWIDADGSVSQLGEATLVGSGHPSAESWWQVDSEVVYDPQGPLRFIKANLGPERGLGHFRLLWDSSEHNNVGSSVCSNGKAGVPCPALGYVRHSGKLSTNYPGLPITATGDVVGPVGGYGWIIKLTNGAPRSILFTEIELDPETPLLVSIAYPPGTTFVIKADTKWCGTANGAYACSETFQPAASLDEIRDGPGNTYFVDANGVVTFRIVQTASNFVGNPDWFIPSRETAGRDGVEFALPRFEHSGVILPVRNSAFYSLEATCGGSGPYCSESVEVYDPDVCPANFEQVAYDRCCSRSDSDSCVYANGSTESGERPSPGPICFSKSNTVQVHGRGTVPIDTLKIGDYVLTGSGAYSRVYSFGHLDPESSGKYLHIETSEGKHLEISERHMIRCNGRFVPAVTVAVGDELYGRDSFSTVSAVSVVTRQGLYMPITETGDIVVSGVLASSYVSLLEDGGFIDFHWFSHAGLAPFRLVCRWNFSWCQHETYTAEGKVSHRLFFVLQAILGVNALGPTIAGVLAGLCLPFLAVFLVIEQLSQWPAILVLTTVLPCVVVRRRTIHKKNRVSN